MTTKEESTASWIPNSRFLVLGKWLALFVVLAVGAYFRFRNILDLGVSRGDGFQYLAIARLWSEGKFVFTDAEPPYTYLLFFRPILFALNWLGVELFGYKDHALKLIHASLDMLSILLVYRIGVFVSGLSLVGLFASALYATSPIVIEYARNDLAHIPSAFFVLLSFLVFLHALRSASQRNNVRRTLLLFFASGICTAACGLVHGSLGLLGGAYVGVMCVAGIVAFVQRQQTMSAALLDFIRRSAVFTLGFLATYGVSGLIFGFDVMISAINGEKVLKKTTPMAPFELAYRLFFESISTQISGYMLKAVIISAAIAAVISIVRRSFEIEKWSPLLLFLIFLVCFDVFVTRNVVQPLLRLQIPFFPLLFVFVGTWLFELLRVEKIRNWQRFALIGGVFGLLAVHVAAPSWVSGINTETFNQSTHYRWAYNLVGAKTSSDQKILIAPSYAGGYGFNSDLYFNGNAVYLNDLCAEKGVSGLEEITQQYKIKYVLISTGPGFMRGRDLSKFGKCFRSRLQARYSPYEEAKLIRLEVKEHSGQLVGERDYLELYEMP